MLVTLSLLLSCQLAGELVARGAGLPVPGPVVGLLFLLMLLVGRPALLATLRPTVTVILANLSLFFVPAAVGVVANLDILSADWAAILTVLLISTVLAMLVAVVTFVVVRKTLVGEVE
jgi:putative effector of murein hydrolase LrgA (UPF0299 family)